MSQVARPASDVSTGSWGSTPLWSKLNEVTPDDASKVTSVTDPTGDTFEVRLGTLAKPSAGTQTLSVRVKKTDSAAIDVTVVLLQGNAVIAKRTATVTTSFATFDWSLTSGEAAAITDYTDLRARVTAGTPRKVLIYTGGGDGPSCGSGAFDELIAVYQSLGIPVSVSSSWDDTAKLAFILAPATAAGVPTTDIANWLDGGGVRLVVTSEHSGFPGVISAANSILSALGVSLSSGSDLLDCDCNGNSGNPWIATMNVGHALGVGAPTFRYACYSPISGGTALSGNLMRVANWTATPTSYVVLSGDVNPFGCGCELTPFNTRFWLNLYEAG